MQQQDDLRYKMSNYSDALLTNNNNNNNSKQLSCNQQQLNKSDNQFNSNPTTNTYNLFSKNFTTYMKYSDSNSIIDINMGLATQETKEQPPTTQLKNANSFELDQFKAEKLFNNTKESRLNDLLAAASLSIKYNNEQKLIKADDLDDHSSGFFLKRQTNGIQSNLFQYCDQHDSTTSANNLSNSFAKKEINTIAIDQVLDKLTNSIKNDKKLSSNIRFNNETSPLETKSSICSSSSASHSSSSSSCSSSRTESNEKQPANNLISLSRNKQQIAGKVLSTNQPKIFHPLQTGFQSPLAAAQTDNAATALATGSSSSSSLSKNQFNIENELIKYTKNLKLNSQPYTDYYKLGVHIRNGGFSEIYEGIQMKSNEKVIVKLIPKRKTKNWLMVHNKKYPAEILLHKMSNCITGVVKMLEFYEQENEWIIIMPKMFNCLDLFDYLESKQRGRLSEAEACHFFTQLVKINIDLLNQGVVHRDLKSENILVDLDSMNLILIDFGASAICRSNKTTNSTHFYTDFHGTRQYKPPEYITNKKYTALASTIWTLGILLYDMCNGQLPFETEQEILEYNLQIKANVSDEYKKLLFDCLKLDPLLRPNLDQVLEYSWCVNNSKQFNTTSSTTIPSNNSATTMAPSSDVPNTSTSLI